MDEKWANLLLDGQVFMRSLFSFGGWSVLDQSRDPVVNNTFRGDLREGAFRVYKSPEDHPFIKDMDSDFKQMAQYITDVDMAESQYFKIFSTYALKFDKTTQSFLTPDNRIQEFGDTAVVIHDFESFLQRFVHQIRLQFSIIPIPFLQKISYYDYSMTKDLIPIFSKHIEYSYQNELRIAIGLLEKNKFSINHNVTIIPSTESLTLELGNIRDIAYTISVHDLINLRLPKETSFRFPRLCNQTSCHFNNMVKHSKKDLKNFVCPIYKPVITIY